MKRDRTLALFRQGYPWGSRLRQGAAAVATRLLGRRTVVISGPDGVRRFYDSRLQRKGAFPLPIRLVLFGPRSIHGLDDEKQHHQKAMYLEILTPESVAALGQRAEQEWATAVRRWPDRERVVLFDEAVQVIAASALPWAGVPVAPEELPSIARKLADLLNGFATPGKEYLRAAAARWQLDRWAASLVQQTRTGQLHPAPNTALHIVSTTRDVQGKLLSKREAGVALLNIVRPPVAVAWFVAFAGKALHDHPEWRERIAGGDEAALDAFVQEVRRFYPFVPVLPARTRHKQDVFGIEVPRRGRVVLDVHGTDHDPEHWPEPDRFDPNRFLRGNIEPDTLVPQGGGDVRTGHRCPGESATLTLLVAAVRALVSTRYTLPPQDLGYSLSRMPTRPRSGVVLTPQSTVARQKAGKPAAARIAGSALAGVTPEPPV